MRLALAFTLGTLTATPIASAVTYAAIGGAMAEIAEQHARADAELRYQCVLLGVAAERVQRRTTQAIWAQRGPTGGELVGFVDYGEGE